MRYPLCRSDRDVPSASPYLGNLIVFPAKILDLVLNPAIAANLESSSNDINYSMRCPGVVAFVRPFAAGPLDERRGILTAQRFSRSFKINNGRNTFCSVIIQIGLISARTELNHRHRRFYGHF
jgi:hypothetical protein